MSDANPWSFGWSAIEALGTVVLSGGIIYAALQLRFDRDNAAIERTSEMIREWNRKEIRSKLRFVDRSRHPGQSGKKSHLCEWHISPLEKRQKILGRNARIPGRDNALDRTNGNSSFPSAAEWRGSCPAFGLRDPRSILRHARCACSRGQARL